MSRKYCEPVPESAHRLISVPGDLEGPGGVLVLCENSIVYKKPSFPEISCPVPRWNDMEKEQGLHFIAYSVLTTKNQKFYLIQSEFGDVYKITLDCDKNALTQINC